LQCTTAVLMLANQSPHPAQSLHPSQVQRSAPLGKEQRAHLPAPQVPTRTAAEARDQSHVRPAGRTGPLPHVHSPAVRADDCQAPGGPPAVPRLRPSEALLLRGRQPLRSHARVRQVDRVPSAPRVQAQAQFRLTSTLKLLIHHRSVPDAPRRNLFLQRMPLFAKLLSFQPCIDYLRCSIALCSLHPPPPLQPSSLAPPAFLPPSQSSPAAMIARLPLSVLPNFSPRLCHGLQPTPSSS